MDRSKDAQKKMTVTALIKKINYYITNKGKANIKCFLMGT